MKSVSLLLLFLLLTFCTSGVAADFAISLDSVVGLYGSSGLNTGQIVTFYLRLTNNGTYPMKGITNGYRVYSPNGATWNTTVGDNDLGTLGSSDFDLGWFINTFSLTGSGADTLGFGGATLSGTGLPASFDDTAYTITIGPIPAQDHGKTICLDSVFYPPSGIWKWTGGVVNNQFIGERIPTWDGPHCFTVLDAGGGQSLVPSPGAIILATEEGNPSEGQSLQIDVSDGGNPLSFSLANGPTWLDLDVTNGTTPATGVASALVDGLAPGEYSGTVSLTAAGAVNSPLEVPCVLRVNPVLTAMPYWGFFVFATGGDQAPAETLVITATDGVSSIPFTATADSGWLTVTPGAGVTPETLTVVSDGRSLEVGKIHSSRLTVAPSGDGLTPSQVLYKVKIVDLVTAVREIHDGNLPGTYTLSQNYPNPFNPTTQIAFDLPTRSQVTLTVYNVLGQQVTTLVNEKLAAGSYEADWDGRSSGGNQVASGIYFYRLHTDSFTQTKKMILLK